MKKFFTKFLMATAFFSLVAGSFVACESPSDEEPVKETGDKGLITVRDEVFPIERAVMFKEQRDSSQNQWAYSIVFGATKSNKDYRNPGLTTCIVELVTIGDEITSGVYPLMNIPLETDLTKAGGVTIHTHDGGMADDSTRIACCWFSLANDKAITVTNLGQGRYKIELPACVGEMYCGAEDGSFEQGTASLIYEGKIEQQDLRAL